MPIAMLSAGADPRLGRRSRDAADHLDANFTVLCVTPAISPRIFRTALSLIAPHSRRSIVLTMVAPLP